MDVNTNARRSISEVLSVKELSVINERFRRMNEMRKDKQLLDYALVSENGEHVWGHWIVMSSSSPLIEKISLSIGKGKVLIKSISAESLEHIVNYMYTAEIDLTRDNVNDILAGASLMQMSFLQEACLDFLKNNSNGN